MYFIKIRMSKIFIYVASIILGVKIIVLYILNDQLKKTYMDEYFHWDQTLKYCDFDFYYWNNKLTTFPLL